MQKLLLIFSIFLISCGPTLKEVTFESIATSKEFKDLLELKYPIKPNIYCDSDDRKCYKKKYKAMREYEQAKINYDKNRNKKAKIVIDKFGIVYATFKDFTKAHTDYYVEKIGYDETKKLSYKLAIDRIKQNVKKPMYVKLGHAYIELLENTTSSTSSFSIRCYSYYGKYFSSTRCY